MSPAPLRTRLPSFRDRLALGGSGLQVSPYCLGAVRDASAVVEAYERGINFFFLTADMHWPAYEATRRGLRDLLRTRPSVRGEIVVGAVSYVADPDFALVPFHEVLGEIAGLERIEVTIAGGVRSSEDARFTSFASHRGGSVPGARAMGATFHDRPAAATCVARGDADVGFIRYNAAHRGAERDLFPLLPRDRTTRVFNFKSTRGFVPHHRFPELRFEEGAWRPGVTDHYRFVLARPEIDGVLCSPGDAAEVASLERAIERGPLASEQLSYMRSVTDLHLGRLRAKSGGPAQESAGNAEGT